MSKNKDTTEPNHDTKSIQLTINYADCKNCALNKKRPVLGYGNPTAKYVVVGEAPGKTEVREEKPFVGQSGKLIKLILTNLGIDTEDVWWTNTCLCRPTGNETPNAQSVKACRDRLLNEIKLVDPDVIIALGATAAKNILNSTDSISKLREGNMRRAFGYDTIVTYHPAACLRKGAEGRFVDIYNDISKLKFKDTHIEPTQYTVVSSDNISWALNSLLSYGIWALDFETTGLSHTKDAVLCLGIAYKKGSAVVFPYQLLIDFKDQINDTFKRFIGAGGQAVWHNAKFDLKFMRKMDLYPVFTDDTMLMHYALDDRSGAVHNLEHVAAQTVGAPPYKDMVDKYKTKMAECPEPLLHEYCATDVDLTRRVYVALLKHDDWSDVEDLYKQILIPASSMLTDVEYHGISVDVKYTKQLREQFTQIENQIEQELNDKFKLQNPRSPKQVTEALNTKFNVKVKSTDKTTLQELTTNKSKSVPSVSDFAELLLKYRRYQKLNSTYVKGVLKRMHNDHIHTNFKIHGTETGRLSSADPNLQNIPRDSADLPNMRSMFVPGKNNMFVQCDYSGAELRVMAANAQEQGLIDIFNEGRSLHKEVANRFFGTGHTKEKYVRAKNINFGIAYQAGPNELSKYTETSVAEAQEVIDQWFSWFPNVKDYMDTIKSQVLTDGYLTTRFGRKRRFWLITNENKESILKEACNFPIQSEASDLNLIAAIRLSYEFPGKIRVLVHDSIMVEVHEEVVMGTVSALKTTMEDVGREFMGIEFAVDAEVGNSWGSLQELT